MKKIIVFSLVLLFLSCADSDTKVSGPSATAQIVIESFYEKDEEALKAYQLVSKLEKISPSLEPSHAFAEAIKIAPRLSKHNIIICNSCGDSLKDKDIIKNRLGKYTR